MATKAKEKVEAQETPSKGKISILTMLEQINTQLKEMTKQIRDLNDSMGKLMTAKKIKKVKDPNAPKHPRNAYMIYCNEHRKRVSAEMKGASTTKVVSQMSAEWKKLTDADKAKYNAEAKKEREQYKVDKAKYEKTRKTQ